MFLRRYCPQKRSIFLNLISQDYYIYRNEQNLVPFVYYQTKNNWFASLRYNYEENETFSLQLGRTFSGEGTAAYSFTPLAGLLAGKYSGFSIATQTEIEIGRFSLYTEPELCLGFKTSPAGFFYNWSELSIQPTKHFYTGIALQTVKYKLQEWEAQPGLMFGIIANNFEIPLYFFNPARSSSYFVAGIHWKLQKE